MKLINRCVVVIRAKEPYYEWANSFAERRGGPRMDPERFDADCPVFLVPEPEDKVDRFMRQEYERIFKHYLVLWVRDPDLWPEGKDYEMFRQWFDWEVHPLGFDMGAGRVRKE